MTDKQVEKISITESGKYALHGNVKQVVVDADDVVLDMQGHEIICGENEIGINANKRARVTILNGTISNCRIGMSAPYSKDVIVENVRFVREKYIGLYLSFGRGHKVKNCLFADIAGDGIYAVGLNGTGSESVIEKNEFRVEPTKGEGVAIIVSSGDKDAIVRDNRMAVSTPGSAIAVWVAEDSSAYFSHNVIEGYDRRIVGGGEIRNLDAASVSR